MVSFGTSLQGQRNRRVDRDFRPAKKKETPELRKKTGRKSSFLPENILKRLSTLVQSFGITVTYFVGVQAALPRALLRRRIISFVKSSRVKVHWNGAADFS